MGIDGGVYRILIVAAGCSRRMKKFKPLLPVGDKTMIEHTISRFLEVGMKDIVVVVGYKKNELIPILEKYSVQIVVNELYDHTDMIDSVKLGLAAMPTDTRGVLLCPADIPFIEPSTINALVEAAKRTDAFAVIPSYDGRRGHPLLFGRRIYYEILRYRGDNGIHGILEKFADRITYVEVPDKNMLIDVDRPEEYQRLLEIYDEVYVKKEVL